MKRLFAMAAAAALMTAPAWAGGDKSKEQQQTQTGSEYETQGMGGAGQMGQEQEISGKVVKMKGNTLYLKTDQGALVPVDVKKDTQFMGANVTSKNDIKEGQEVRASFTVQEDQLKNMATRINVESEGMGGSGEDMGTEPSPQPMPEDIGQQPQPEEPGTTY